MKKLFLTALLVAAVSSSTAFAADVNLNFGTAQTPFVYHAGQRCEVTATFKDDFEARPVSLFVQKAKQFKSAIKLEFNDKTANAKSITELLSMRLHVGDTVTLVAEGADAQQAVDTLRKAIEACLAGY